MRHHATTALLLCVAGCDPGQDASSTTARGEWTGTERDSAGIRIVSNPRTGMWTEATTWTVERDLAIGVVEGDADYEFGRVVDIGVGSEGRIYVLDQQAAQVRVFDSGGSHLFSFGRSGQGPGELSSNNPLGAGAVLMAAGELVVPDFENRRVNRFAVDGEFIASFPVRPEAGIPVASSILSNGDYVVHRVSTNWNGVLRIDSLGEVLDTILEFDLQPSPWGMSTPTPTGRREAFTHSPLWATTSDGRLVSGNSDQYRIEVRGSQRSLEMVIEKEEDDPVLSRHERERFLDRLLELWAEMFRARGEREEWIQAQLREGRDLYILPERLPAFTGIAGGPEGTIWVRRTLPIGSMTAHVLQARRPLREFWSPNWEVFSRDGRFLGEVVLPSRFTLYNIRGWHLYGVDQDGLGVQRVVRLRVRAPDGPSSAPP